MDLYQIALNTLPADNSQSIFNKIYGVDLIYSVLFVSFYFRFDLLCAEASSG